MDPPRQVFWLPFEGLGKNSIYFEYLLQEHRWIKCYQKYISRFLCVKKFMDHIKQCIEQILCN